MFCVVVYPKTQTPSFYYELTTAQIRSHLCCCDSYWKRFLSDNRGLLAQVYFVTGYSASYSYCNNCLVRVTSEVTHKLYINQL